ncbi:L,D-transpeptidase family protein, partial [Streptomyces reticuliscabiei]
MISRPFVLRGLTALLVAVAVLPVGPAVADPVPSPAPAPGSGTEGVLVPGVPPAPSQPWSFDTPDQLLAPQVYTPTREEDAVEPSEAARGTYDLIEYVPLREAANRVACSKLAGPYQRQVEFWLKLRVDGKQSAADCRAIRAFQRKYKIKPDSGFAGPVTWSRMQLLSARKNPNAAGKCPVRTYRVACVDLGRQLTWVQKGKKVVYGPVPVRTGRTAYPTRGGWHKVYWKHKNHHSTLYDTPMPYAQFFSGGQA